jgi:hypothetical protein
MSAEGLVEACVEKGVDPLTLRPYANSGHGRFLGTYDSSAKGMIRKRLEKPPQVGAKVEDAGTE